jgi:hypothetical protein
MSGSAGGLLIIPLLLGAVPVIGTVLVGGALVAAASVAASVGRVYEESRRRKRERIRQSEAGEPVGSFRKDVLKEMEDQTCLNAEVSNRMMAELECSRQEVSRVLEDSDPGRYQEYLNRIRDSRAELNGRMMEMQAEFTKNYRGRAAASIEKIGRDAGERQAAHMEDLRSMQASESQKNELAKSLAERYLDEARTLIDALRDDFDGEVFSGPRLASLVSQWNSAVEQCNAGRWESSIAVAKGVALSTVEEIYDADCKKQDWENCHKLALVQASEIKSYLEAQSVITPEIRRQLEEKAGRQLEQEIVGVKPGDYTDVTETGETQYDFLLRTTQELWEELEKATPAKMPLPRLKGILAHLNESLYPNAMTVLYKGMLNMSNAFTRQRLSEEIIDFFEEHDFTFSGYDYENDDHGGALHIGLENGVTGEELVVTLAPDVTSSGDIRTQVKIDQLSGDETNEERKAYYRQAVQEVVAESLPGAKLSLECDRSTRSKLSPNTELKDRLKR